MGGSLAMRLKGQCARLIGFDSHPPTLELALSKGIIDHALDVFPSPRGEGLGVRAKLTSSSSPPLSHPSSTSSTNYREASHRNKAPITTPQLPSSTSAPRKRDILQAMSALPEQLRPHRRTSHLRQGKTRLRKCRTELYIKMLHSSLLRSNEPPNEPNLPQNKSSQPSARIPSK